MTIHVLQVLGKEPIGGVGSFIRTNMSDTTTVKFDVIDSPGQKSNFNEFVKSKNGRVFIFPRLNKRELVNYWKKTFLFYKKNAKKYDIVHVNSPVIALPHMLFATMFGIKTRIYHAHSASYSDSFLKSIRNMLIIKIALHFATDFLACGKMAGQVNYGKRAFTIIRNGVEADRFRYDMKQRIETRKKYNVNKKFVVGFVGTLTKIKNIDYIIKIAEKMRSNKVQFMLVGDGNEKKRILQLIKQKNIKNMCLLGNKKNMQNFYNAFDVLLLPSRREGFPMVTLEAQSSGLPLIVSSNIDRTINITGNVAFLRINNSELQKWVMEIEKKNNELYLDRNDGYMKIKKHGYDVVETKYALINYYETAMKKR